MVDKIHYRWDFIGLSTDTKPTPAESPKVVNGSTYYESDTSKLFVFYKDTWYERKPLGGGGGSDINVVQTTGDSTTDVMSQKAVTDVLNALPTGGATELTSADYNWPTDNPNSVALWLLDSGWYAAPGILVRYDSSTSYGVPSNGAELFYVSKATAPTGASRISVIGTDNTVTVYSTQLNNGSKYSEPTKTVNVVQATGTSTTNVMSQKAVTGMVYASGYEPSTGSSDGNRVAIGGRSMAGARTTIAIGAGRTVTSALAIDSVALGEAATVGNSSYRGSVALGSYAECTAQGQVQIGSSQTTDGYNSSNYRLLSGLYDGQSAHDAVTVGQVNSVIDAINTALSTNIPHIGA